MQMHTEKHDSAEKHDTLCSYGVVQHTCGTHGAILLCEPATVLPSIVSTNKNKKRKFHKEVELQTQRMGTAHDKRQIETEEDDSLEHLNALFGDVTDHDIVAKKKRKNKLCVHDKRKTFCRHCSPGNYCHHNSLRSTCRYCTPSILCQHDRRTVQCKICNQSVICKHNGRKRCCRICTPNSMCRHDKVKDYCRECKPRIICRHDKLQKYCRDCKGSSYCVCGILKAYCPKHGGGKLCIRCKLITANRKYDKHCVDCFVNFYPDDPRSDNNSRLKRRETVVREAIDGAFKGFIHDKAFYTGGCCEHRRRIDHRIPINGTLLAIETDENAHVSKKKYDEIIRYDDLFMAIGTKFVFIRFNCDTNREEYGAKTSLEHKIQSLLECIATQIARIEKNANTELCDIVKLFYCALCSKNGNDICKCPKLV